MVKCLSNPEILKEVNPSLMAELPLQPTREASRQASEEKETAGHGRQLRVSTLQVLLFSVG